MRDLMLSFVEHDFEVGFHAYLLVYLKNLLRNPRPLHLRPLRQVLRLIGDGIKFNTRVSKNKRLILAIYLVTIPSLT